MYKKKKAIYYGIILHNRVKKEKQSVIIESITNSLQVSMVHVIMYQASSSLVAIRLPMQETWVLPWVRKIPCRRKEEPTPVLGNPWTEEPDGL